MSGRLRVAGVLVGDMDHQPDMRAKYGGFFEALGRHFELVEIYDASLRGFGRYLNALRTFNPSVPYWKEHFFKNVPAFQTRSRRLASHLRRMHNQVDVVLQLGALFDATWDDSVLPVVVYTDNTTRISARYPDSGRTPLKPDELARWLVYESQFYHRSSHVCVRADIVRRSLIQDYGLPGERISVVGGGVNFTSIPNPLGVGANGPPTALFIGKDFYRKGGDLVLHSFAQARSQVPDARLIMVTEKTIPSGLPLDGVHILPPTWQRDVIENLYCQADVLILPSRLETWGDVLLEAMAFGLPCIGVQGQAMEEIIRHGKTGLLVPPGQPQALASALTQLLAQPELRRRMGQAARAHVTREFTWERVVERIAPWIDVAARRSQRFISNTSS
jgi:glycosyltransferase involved in cell wall biosynthesis